MLKKLITYTDFDGNERTEEFYFNLTKGELVEMELTGEDNSLSAALQKISDSNSGKLIIPQFKNILRKAYGQKSEDGKRFVKSDALSTDFESTAAYSELFFELTTDAEAAAAFIRGVMPTNMSGPATGADKTPAQIARERSEAQLQGHKPKQPSQPETVRVADLPTDQNIVSPVDTNVPTEAKKQTRAELLAQLAALEDE